MRSCRVFYPPMMSWQENVVIITVPLCEGDSPVTKANHATLMFFHNVGLNKFCTNSRVAGIFGHEAKYKQWELGNCNEWLSDKVKRPFWTLGCYPRGAHPCVNSVLLKPITGQFAQACMKITVAYLGHGEKTNYSANPPGRNTNPPGRNSKSARAE